MATHQWGDEDFDWNSLNEAIRLTTTIMTKWGRIGFHSKEKYGEMRGYTYFYDGGLHSLLYPGYVYSQFPQWLWSLDCRYFWKITKRLGLNWLVGQWQKKVYNWGYQAAIKKYPHIASEIIAAADWPELIDGYYKIEYKALCKALLAKDDLLMKEFEEAGQITKDFFNTLPNSIEKNIATEKLGSYFGWSQT